MRDRIEFDPIIFSDLKRVWSTKSYLAGEAIYHQGDIANEVLYLKTGAAKIMVVAKDGRVAVPTILESGSFFGVYCLIGHTLRQSTTFAMMKCEVLGLNFEAMTDALRDDPKLSKTFIDFLLYRAHRAQDDIVNHLVNSTEQRLARLLLRLALYTDDGKLEIIYGKISHEALSEMVGTTRSRVCGFMVKFRELGYVSYCHDARDLQIDVSLRAILLENNTLN
jgi:CRP/FNR family transcriptional regulator, cyclic AMP receptor protein